MPYLTPQDLPEGDDCRPLLIPASTEWLALFGGALTELTKPYNWQDSGGLTVAETVARMQEIIDQWYIVACGEDCTLPEGGSVIRIGDHGELEQLIDGEWQEPEGDYFIPPPEAREGGSSEDQICLAAANAVNAIKTLYQSLSDSFAENLNEIAALDAIVGVASIFIGFAFAPITYGIYIFLSRIFAGVYFALSYLTADLWTDDFSDQIECFLVACGTNDAGVVTFDWDCFMEKLNSLANDFSLSETQLRLYIQFGYILQFIGGADGLNLAGGTTEIETNDCSDCNVRWCRFVDFTLSDGGFVSDTILGIGANYEPGVGWTENDIGATSGTYIRYDDFPIADVDFIQFIYTTTGHVTDATIYAELSASTVIYVHAPAEVGVDEEYHWEIETPVQFDLLALQVGNQTAGGAEGTSVITRVELHGSGTPPDWGDVC